MSLFQKASNRQAYFKAGLFGFEGSGKTMTACLLAIGLAKLIRSKKPISFFDTETGSDYVLPLFEKEGLELQVVKSRAIKTLADGIKEAESTSDILIVDSLTHPYRKLCSTYTRSKKSGGKFIDIRDWAIIKQVWGECVSLPYVNTRLHLLWCARAKNLFEDVEDVEASEGGRKVFRPIQVGTAARAETESSYEPSILIEMTREMAHDGGKYIRRATVVKDRFNVIDGASFDNPSFDNFWPHIKLLNLGGEHLGVVEETSEALFLGDDRDVAHRRHRQKVAWERVENSLAVSFPSAQGKDKQARFGLDAEPFGATSGAQLQQLPPDALEKAVAVIERLNQQMIEGYVHESLMELKKHIRVLQEIVTLPELPSHPEETPPPDLFKGDASLFEGYCARMRASKDPLVIREEQRLGATDQRLSADQQLFINDLAVELSAKKK